MDFLSYQRISHLAFTLKISHKLLGLKNHQQKTLVLATGQEIYPEREALEMVGSFPTEFLIVGTCPTHVLNLKLAAGGEVWGWGGVGWGGGGLCLGCEMSVILQRTSRDSPPRIADESLSPVAFLPLQLGMSRIHSEYGTSVSHLAQLSSSRYVRVEE